MCLIITALAAIVTTLLWCTVARKSRLKVGALALMYWGATVMWIIDGIFSIAGGGVFADISGTEAILGLICVACGVFVWLLWLLITDPKGFASRFRSDKR